MVKWIPLALVRVAFFFIGGVLFGIYHPACLKPNVAAALFLSLVGFYSLVVRVFKKSAERSSVVGLIGLSAIFIAGFINVLYQTELRKPDHIQHVSAPIEMYRAKLIGAPEERDNSWRMAVEVSAIKENEWRPATGKVLLYISKESGEIGLKYADEILISGSPVEITPPGNPHEFDFKRYLSFKGIYHQQFVKREQIQFVAAAQQHDVLFYSHQVRAWASDVMKQFVEGKQEQAIALALVLGVTDGLDNELQDAYAASGAMHVLAVSGLHVGIIYWMILLVLKPIRSFSWSRWVIALVSLLCLWAYAFVTGLSPSVLRAVTMFSFVAVASAFSRNTNIYNTLAASALILLIYNPFLIMSVGFQLSYLAVLGIVYLQRPIYNVWEPQSKVMEWCWSITCVSVAAQIATFALGLLYFHQFPVYFLFSNLFVIPGSFAVLVLGILLLAVSFLQPLAYGVGSLLEWSIKILNMGVFAFEDLPYSLINGVYLTTFQCWLLMGVIISIICLFEFRKFGYLAVACLLTMIFSGAQWQHHAHTVDQRQLLVYRVKGHQALEWIDHGKSYFYCDSSLWNDPQRIRFHIRPNRIASSVSVTNANDPGLVKTLSGFRYFSFHEAKVLLLDNKEMDLPNNLTTDYVIVSNNALHSLDNGLKGVTFKKLVLDSSNSLFYATKIVEQAKLKNIPIHDVLTQGAFIANL